MNDHWYERRQARDATRQDPRTPLEVDYARVVHSSSFRRLQGKTQIHQVNSDIPRTRLTHSIEVSQIALGIAQRLKAAHLANPVHDLDPIFEDASIWHIVGLCHDLGHPCGGHSGEDALNSCLPYEGNGQTLRILATLETHTPGLGLNLTRRSLLGILKYPVSYSQAAKGPTPPPRRGASGIPLIGPEHQPPKCYLDNEEPIVAWMLGGMNVEASIIRQEKLKSFDAGLMDLADDFAYSVADLDDAIAMDLISSERIFDRIADVIWEPFVEHYNANLAPLRGNKQLMASDIVPLLIAGTESRNAITAALINYLLANVRLKVDERMADPLYRYFVELEPAAKRLVQALKELVYDLVICSTAVQRERVRTQRRIIELFDVLNYQPQRYLPDRHRALFAASGGDERIIADYIAGMTDRFLETTHNAILG